MAFPTLTPRPRHLLGGFGNQQPLQGPQTPPPGNYAYRGPQRGYVHQIGNAPRVDPYTNETTAQSNAHNFLNPEQDAQNWKGMFPNSKIAGPTGIAPQNDTQRFNDTFAANRPVTPAAPQQSNRIDPLALPANPNTPDPKYLTPGTKAPQIHSAPSVSPDWQKQIMDKYPAIGIAGSPQNKAFLDAFNQHGAPERGLATADTVMRGLPASADNPKARQGSNHPIGPKVPPASANYPIARDGGESLGPNPPNADHPFASAGNEFQGPQENMPGMVDEKVPIQPPPQQPPQTAQATEPPVQWDAPEPQPAKPEFQQPPAAPPPTYAESIDQLYQTQPPKIGYHANPELDPLSGPRIGGAAAAPFDPNNYPARPAIHPLDPGAYTDPATNPVRLGLQRIGDAFRAPTYRRPKPAPGYTPIDPLASN